MDRKQRGVIQGEPVTRQVPQPAGGVRLETFIPWTLVKKTCKKQIITPIDAPQEFLEEARQERLQRKAEQDTPLVRALGLAHYWKSLLDEDKGVSIADIAEAEGVDASHVRRLLRLTLLSPAIVEKMLVSPEMKLEHILRRPIPNSWREQQQLFDPPA